ncbi:MAG: 2-dehydropantoate 2-reductase [Alphaproteobacteria bacterium]|nr:2-dehydropantoate 2-reductase [Alphaproteobacteria bacterium]
MRIAVVGAGAIGGAIAHALAVAGMNPLLVARGDTAKAVARDGLRVVRDGKTELSRPAVLETTQGAAPCDVVIGTAKAHDWAAMAGAIRPLVGPRTAVLPAINGIPWWFFRGMGGAHRDTRLGSLDPSGELTATFAPENIVGCVVYMAASRPAPGVVEWPTGRRLVIGGISPDCVGDIAAIARLLRSAGLEIDEATDIRREVWMKLLGNAGFNSVSALTRATVVEILDDPDLRAICADTIRELKAVASASGTDLDINVEARLEAARRLGHFKTSTLQDFEAGRPLEIAALLDAPAEIGAMTGVSTPVLATLARLLRRAAASRKGA